MTEIKTAYLAHKLTMIEAAKLLSRHNGNPLAGNLTIVRRWSA